jgi:hypothetical protein
VKIKEGVLLGLRIPADNILNLIDLRDKNVFTRGKSTTRTVYEIHSENQFHEERHCPDGEREWRLLSTLAMSNV